MENINNTLDNTTAAGGTTVNTALAKFKEFGVSDEVAIKIVSDLGIETAEDLGMLTEADLVGGGMKPIQARRFVASVKPATQAVAAESAQINAAVSFDNILPLVPDDVSWLQSLKSGGVLKVDQSTVISAIRAALANKVGMFEITAKLVSAMEKYADTNEDPVDPSFFKLRQQITQRTYGDLFEAIPGLTGNFVTDGRKKQLFDRIEQYFWPAVIGFYNQLKSWQEAWMSGATSPGILMATFMSGGHALPPGMMQAPDTGVLHDQSEALNNAINKVFAGTNVQIAAAMASEAMQIKKTLEDPRIPSLVGAPNRDMMLKQLNAAVSPTYPRLETNLVRFVLAAVQSKDQPAGNDELQYFGALYMLGSQIPWDQLGGAQTVSAVGGRSKL